MNNNQKIATNIEYLASIPYLDMPYLHNVSGEIAVLGSKSISNRALLLASVCKNSTNIHGLLHSDDTKVMLDALKILGVDVNIDQEKNIITIKGNGTKYPNQQANLFMGNAGTAMRPLTAMLACMGGEYTLHGVPRMHERPIKDLVDGLAHIGANIEYLNNDGYPPIKILSPNFDFTKKIMIKGNVSSQFLSSLLMAIPTLGAEQDIKINIDGELISKPYVYLTLAVMQKFGVNVIHNLDDAQNNYLIIPKDSIYISPSDFYVEGDASSASYMIASGVIAGNESITVTNVGKNSIQGDIAFVDALKQMGAKIEQNEFTTTAYKSNLVGAEIDCIAIPDAAMTLATVALFAHGSTTLYNIESWKVKETDRILAMYNELTKLGAVVEYSNNHIKITPPVNDSAWQQPHQGINTYDDHRMAMCFALCAFSDKLNGIKINHPACIAKTYPEFFTHLYGVVGL
ncbi:MAG: hypothetical protein RLZZ210_811 [Pseudomonadota bacterium]